MFLLNVDGRREPMSGDLLPNGLVLVHDRESGQTGYWTTAGSAEGGALASSGWARFVAIAVADHFGYDMAGRIGKEGL